MKFTDITNAYQAAGFEIEDNRISPKNDWGVSIIDFLDAKNAESKENSRRGKNFISRKFDNTHCVVYRDPKQVGEINFATIEKAERF